MVMILCYSFAVIKTQDQLGQRASPISSSTDKGNVQLAWAPSPKSPAVSISNFISRDLTA